MDDSQLWPDLSASGDIHHENGSDVDGAQSLAVGASVSLNRMFSVLADRDRRYALYYLYNRGGDVPLAELVACVVASRIDDADPVPDAVPDDAFERSYGAFVDTHLPELALSGVIDYHVEDDWVLLSANTDVVDERLLVRLLTLAARFERPSSANAVR